MMILLGHVFKHLQASFRAEIWDFIRQSMQKNCLKIILNRCRCLVSSEAASCHHANRKIKAGQFIIRMTGDHKHSRTFKNHSSYITIAHIDQISSKLGSSCFSDYLCPIWNFPQQLTRNVQESILNSGLGCFYFSYLCYLYYINLYNHVWVNFNNLTGVTGVHV